MRCPHTEIFSELATDKLIRNPETAYDKPFPYGHPQQSTHSGATSTTFHAASPQLASSSAARHHGGTATPHSQAPPNPAHHSRYTAPTDNHRFPRRDGCLRAFAMTRQRWTVDAIRNLGVTTDLVTAGSILGMGRTKSHELARNGDFPVPVLRVGHRYLVPISGLLQALNISAHKESTSPDPMTGPSPEHMRP
jgi:hypothetical protein